MLPSPSTAMFGRPFSHVTDVHYRHDFEYMGLTTCHLKYDSLSLIVSYVWVTWVGGKIKQIVLRAIVITNQNAFQSDHENFIVFR